MVNRDGSSNKFYYTAVTEKDGKYYPMGAYGRIGYLSKLFNIYGKSEGPKASLSTMDAAYRQCLTKEKAKIKRGYVDYTLSMAESYRAESLSEIEGPTAEATTGGLHAPSSFAMTWEDGTGQSSASIPPNEIAWAEDVKESEGAILGGVAVVGLFAIGLIAAMKFNPANKKKDDGGDSKNAEKGCGCSKTVAKSETVRKHSEYSADRINPVEVEGQNDIRNAESISLPQPNAGPQTAHRQSNRPSLKLW
jgi:predicted DNA-binding WGR domain protein